MTPEQTFFFKKKKSDVGFRPSMRVVRHGRVSLGEQKPSAQGPGAAQPVQMGAQERLERGNEAEETGQVRVSAREPGQ